MRQNMTKQTLLKSPMLPWVLMYLIALTEAIFLSMLIDFDLRSHTASWWTVLMSRADKIASIVLALMTAEVVVRWVRVRKGLCGGSKFRDPSLRLLKLILIQLAAFGIFSWLSIVLVEGNIEATRFADIWRLAWAAAGLGAGIMLLLVPMPAREWLRVARQDWSVMSAIAMIGITAWALGLLAKSTWQPLQGPTFWLVQWLLQVFAQDVVSSPANFLLGTEQFNVYIGPACSGYQGMGLIAAFVGGYLWFFRRNLMFPQAFILLPAGMFAVWLVNALRIAMLLLIGTHVSPDIARGGFHYVGGWFGFIAVALIMVVVTQQMHFFTVTQYEVKARAQESDLTAAYLAPLMALLTIIMVTRVLTITFDWLYPLRVMGTAAVIWIFWRRQIKSLHFSSAWSGSAVGIGVAVFIIWVGIEWVTGNKETGRAIPDSLQEMPTWFATAWLIFRVIGSVITVPIAEELAFRGYALRRLISLDFDKLPLRFTWFSFLLSSFMFGALHGRWVAGTIAGMFYAWAMYRRGKVGDAIIAHGTTNLLIAADVLILGNWYHWN